MRPAMHRLPILAALLLGSPASADDVFAGLYKHGVDTPFTIDIHERGADVALGYRWGRLAALGLIGGPTPYAFASINSHGDTSLAAAGLAWKLGGLLYARPGIGLAIQSGPTYRIDAGARTDLGSRILFEPELALGIQIAPRLALEASWVHVSHAQLFGRQNPGLDMIGLRAAFHLR